MPKLDLNNSQFLSYHFKQATNPKANLVILVGAGGDKSQVVDLQSHFYKQRYSSVSFDFRGRGQSSGHRTQHSLKDQYQEVSYIIDHLETLAPNLPTVLVGHSMGAFVASVMASNIQPDALVLIAPALYMPNHESMTHDQVHGNAKQFIQENQHAYKQATSFKGIASFKGKLLLIMLKKDNIIPSWLVQSYYDAAIQSAHKEMQTLTGATHSVMKNTQWKRELAEIITDWLDKQL